MGEFKLAEGLIFSNQDKVTEEREYKIFAQCAGKIIGTGWWCQICSKWYFNFPHQCLQEVRGTLEQLDKGER